MKYNIIKLEEKDWEWIPSWWVGYDGWDAEIPRDMLPGNGLLGLKILKEGRPIACLWHAELEGSRTMLVNPVLSDPTLQRKRQKRNY